MFTGIIEELGTVRRSEGGELVIGCSTILDGSGLGDSIAVNGVDLTVRAMDADSMTFDVMNETFRRSNLGELVAGDAVNLETDIFARYVEQIVEQ
ncbi:MAG: riboflavin synthase, partial [Chloroflexota bacterium]